MKKKFTHNSKLGFTVPKDYWDGAEDHLMDLITLEKNLSDKAVFKVPENYFEEVENKILLKASVQQPKVVPFYRHQYFKIASMAAAVALALLVFSPSLLNSTSTAEDFSTYVIESEYIYLNPYEIAELLPEKSWKPVQVDNGLTHEEIVDYIAYYTDEANHLNE